MPRRRGIHELTRPPFLAVGAVVLWASAPGRSRPGRTDVKNLSIPAEPLANALNDLAQQSGLQVMFASELVARLRSPEVKGSLTARRRCSGCSAIPGCASSS